MNLNAVLQTPCSGVQMSASAQTHETALAEVVIFVVTHLPAGTTFKGRQASPTISLPMAVESAHCCAHNRRLCPCGRHIVQHVQDPELFL